MFLSFFTSARWLVDGFLTAIAFLGIMAADPAQGEEFEQQKLIPADNAAEDQFSHSVAIWDDTVLVGAIGDDDNGVDSGAAYLFRYDIVPSRWIETAKLLPSDGATEERFGQTVALWGDLAIVGADQDDEKGYRAGAAYIFRFDPVSGTWTEEAKLLASDGVDQDHFGIAVGLSEETAVVGSKFDDDNGPYSGSAYIFRYDLLTGTWHEEAKIIASDGDASDIFGKTVALSGSVVAVGAEGDDDNGVQSGSVYVFRFDSASGTWNEEAKLLPSDGAMREYFGGSLSVDAELIAVGARWSTGNGARSGAGYVYRFDPGSSTWIEEVKLIPSGSEPYDYYGTSIALSEEVVILGGTGEDIYGSNTGAAYSFAYDQGFGTWFEEDKLIPSDGGDQEAFGSTAAIHERMAVVGAPKDNDNGNLSGSAYAFDCRKYPLIDITCNGLDENVIVNRGEAVILEISVESRKYIGYPVDVWVIGTSLSGGASWSYGYHGTPTWKPGIGNVYFTGGLFDFADTVLDNPLPIGMYIAWLVLELNPNGLPDVDYLFDFDSVNIMVVP